VLVLELPTGGLADALGRRPVLVAAAVLDLGALALTAVAGGPAGFLAAGAVRGLSRALDSGPLESWFVDAALALDDRANIERGLGRAGTATGLALAGGSLAAAGLAAGPALGGVDPLVVPVLAAMVARVVHTGALAALVGEPHRDAHPRAVLAGVVDAPRVVRSSVRLLGATPALLALVGVEALWGAGLTGIELLTGPRLVDLLGTATDGVLVFGLASAAGWLASAAGSAAVARGADGGAEPVGVAVWLRVAQGAAAALMAVVGGPAGLVTGYLAFYLAHGAANVVHYGMVHRLVDAAHRTTVLSANSLAGRLGAVAAGAGLGALAGAAGVPSALAVSAVLLAAPVPLYRMAGRWGAGARRARPPRERPGPEGTFRTPQGSTVRDRDQTHAGGGAPG